MTLYTPTRATPDQGRLIDKIYQDMKPFVAGLSGSCYMAETAEDALYYLAQGPGQFVTVIHLGDDRPIYPSGKVVDPVIEAEIIIKIHSNQGFDIDRGSSPYVDKNGSRSLLFILSEIRRRVLSYRITSEVINQGVLYYGGRQALRLPDGSPVKGFQMSFTCYMQMSLETSDKYKTIELA